ncbi:hypothetical protein BBJ29_004639 [Phytophthora kernoviae]|uniref:Uncharacterized protein n=1 Tax=Phytophthora kernoviae TaxID=325452 RepID=A0A3F2RLD4_9STRA|nr:hypothetical protein BBJ29_004639 [Phytophthora kernoviae]RLN58724.1 hypothetical protein BBP00_00006859 [Phytophthora kernoviae]
MSVQARINFFETFSTGASVTTTATTNTATADCTLNVHSIVDYFETIATPATAAATTTNATMTTAVQTRSPVKSRATAPLADVPELDASTPEDTEAAQFKEYVERIWYGDLNHLSYDYQWRQTHMTPADAIPIRAQRKLHTPSDYEDRDNSMVDPATHWDPSESLFPFDSPMEVEDHDEPLADTLKAVEAAEAAQLKEPAYDDEVAVPPEPTIATDRAGLSAIAAGVQAPALPSHLRSTRIPLPSLRSVWLQPIGTQGHVVDNVGPTAANRAPVATEAHRERRNRLAEYRARLKKVRSRLFDFRYSPRYLQQVADAKQRRAAAQE